MSRPDPLERYKAKRDFAKTTEPAGEISDRNGNIFMVQKHDATRLHWDLRLEVDGVLKSWAVTRGPSLNPDDKRLAVRTEDHPMAYATFEGVIPKQEYGGGTVMLWDRGTWAPIAGKSAKDLEKGHLHFVLHGERMKGEWILVRLKPRDRERSESWLLRKVDDEFSGGSDDLVERELTSVSTGRTMEAITAGEKPASQSGRQPKAARRRVARQPAFHPPQLATLVDFVPAGADWIHEVKYDGYRAQVSVANGKATVYTRTGLDWSAKFPEIVEAAAALAVESALIDGEICALNDSGRPDFSSLRNAIKDDGSSGLTMFAFDLLSLDGDDLTKMSNLERKALLARILPGHGRIRYAEHIVGEGEALFKTMCREGYEGIVSKRAGATYEGKRSKAWLKVKCTQRQEFVIVGWTESEAVSRGFRSLLLAVNSEGGLRYAGKVGTGFDASLMADLRARMDKLAKAKAPVEVPRTIARGVHWVAPRLVAEIAFAEFTASKVVRHASFIGLREDKPVSEVVPEIPARQQPDPDAVKITHPDRVVFPGDGITKGQIADYYRQVGAIMLPWIRDRPISLLRCPQGRGKQCFFQKHDSGSFGEAVHKVSISEKDGGHEDYLWIDSIEGLIAAVQMGSIEFHGWGSRASDVERPDRLAFDLDPDEGLDFVAVKKAAVDIKQHLAELGLVSFAMLSGGKGIHVVVPLTPGAKWPEVKDFASRFAQALALAEPLRFVATMAKARRKDRIFIDWLRNQRGSTAVLPYVVRARPHAPVAVPIAWADLSDIETAAHFHVSDAAALIERAASKNLAGWGQADQRLPDF